MHHALRHLGIAVNALEILETGLLNLTCFDDPLTNGGRRFSWCHLTQVGEWHSLYLALYVDTVEQGAGDFGEVSGDLSRGADAVVGGVAVIAAGTGVHGCHEHERAGVFHGVIGPGDGDFSVFERLSQHFEGGCAELRQLVEEEDAVV